MDAYDLFSAMSGVDEVLLERSQYRVKPKTRALPRVLAAAACFALLMIGISMLPGRETPISLSTEPTVSETPGTESTVPAVRPLQLSGGDVGTLNIVQLSQNTEATAMPDFLIYVNQENYYIGDGSGVYYICPKDSSGDLPACKMEFTWQPEISVEDAMQAQAAALQASMAEISEVEKVSILEGMLLRGSEADETLSHILQTPGYENHSLMEGLTIHGSNGSSPDAEQREIYVLSDGQGGVFVFELYYYQEDAEGHGARFLEMLQTFEVIGSPDQTPLWLSSLLDTVMRLTPAFLENDFSDVQDLVTERSDMLTYGENVYADTDICSIYYEVDDDRDPTSAYVSVRHKYLSPDAYDYITIDLSYSGGQWQVNWAYVEP